MSTSNKNTELLKQSLSKNLPLHTIIENEVRKTPFGQMTFTIEIVNGVAKINTLNIVKNIRRKYEVKKTTDEND